MINGVTNPAHATTPSPTRSETSAGQEVGSTKERFGQTDAVELSPAAREQLERDDSASVRTKLVERVRAEIAAGTYLTDEKIDAAVNRIREEMFAVA